MERQLGGELELNNALTGLTVVGHDDERIGDVVRTSFDRSCLFVALKGRFGRKKQHVIHRLAISDVDFDSMTITVRATREEVDDAPEYHDAFDGSSSEAAERYYREVGAAR
jgi:hypothetical protein